MTSDSTHRAAARSERPDLQSATTSELINRLTAEVTDLVRGEFALARTELQAKGKRAGTGAGLAGAAGVVALGGLAALLAAAIAALALVLPVWLSAAIVGVALLVVAGILGLLGKKEIQHATPPVPEQAVHGIQRDVRTVQEGLHHQ